MSVNDIPDNVRQLISSHIRTVNDLEALLLIVNSRREWTAREVGDAMYISPESSEAQLTGLVDARLLARKDENPPRYYYDPSIADDKTVRQLAEVYSRMRVRVIEMIYQNPRTTIQSFADAFKFRKD